jgi:hypothetical protein
MVLLEVKIILANNTSISLCGKKHQAGFFNFEGRFYSSLKLRCNNDENFEVSEFTDMYEVCQGAGKCCFTVGTHKNFNRKQIIHTLYIPRVLPY